jgi:hypothetical protein
MVAYFGVNIGVLAVADALRSTGGSAGLGLGFALFGVLSIIRLRSTELSQHEVAYYFSALALGLIAGLGIEPIWLTASLMGLILLVMFVGDHPRVLPAHRHQTVILDRALAEDGELYARLEEVLHGKVHSATVQELDLVNDKTIVDVRYAYSPRVVRLAAHATPSGITTAAPGHAETAPPVTFPAAGSPAARFAADEPVPAAVRASGSVHAPAGAS